MWWTKSVEYLFALMLEAASASNTSANFYYTTQRKIFILATVTT
jgi:hypothetical protein